MLPRQARHTRKGFPIPRRQRLQHLSIGWSAVGLFLFALA